MTLVAILSVTSAADRLARRDALQVPAMSAVLLGSGAMTGAALDALNAGDIVTARRLGRAAVLRQPIDQPALRTLALTQLAANDPGGGATLRLAGELGWRDPPTQALWARIALDGGDLPVAAQRLDATLRISAGHDPQARATMAAMEPTPAGRAAILDRLRDRPNWTATYLADLAPLKNTALPARAALVAAAARARAVDPATAALVETRLVERARAALAYLIWQARRPAHAAGELPALAFSTSSPAAAVGPFDWSFPPASGITATVETGSPSSNIPVLHVAVDNAGRTLAATRLLPLAPGQYRLRIAIRGAQTLDPVQVELQCAGPSGGLTLGRQEGSAVRVTEFRVPADCPIQRIRLWISGEEGRHSAVLDLGTPRIERVEDGAGT